MERYAECYALLRQMRLFDDLMMRAYFDDRETVQYVLCIILGRDITVKEITVQKDSETSQYHGVRFDVLAVDKDGIQCDIAMFCRYLLRYIDKTRIAAPTCVASFGRQ